MPEHAGVYISPNEVYADLRELKLSVIRIEGQIGEALGDTSEVRQHVGDHETRIRNLEHARWPAATIGTLVGVSGTLIAAVALFR